jgi:hypothetical protein
MGHHGIDKDVIDEETWKRARGLAADFEEHAVADFKDIGLVNDGEAFPPAHGKLAGG